MLRGDEVGVLLADPVLTDPPVVSEDRAGLEPVLACSLVSSQQLGRMAAAAGIAYEETLTGFKWIARAPGPGRRLLFGYEEALGYCVGDLVGDKDGISALVALVRRVAALGGSGTAHWPIGWTSWPATTVSTPPARSRSAPPASTGWPGSPRPCAGSGRSRPRRSAGRAVEQFEDLALPPSRAGCPRATWWCCTSTAPASSCARAAPSPS